MGYTPLFDSMIRGTLYGRWPDIGLWPIVLAIADKNGLVDCTLQYLSGVTGLPAEELASCMGRFCAPDPGSRSQEAAGARLILIDSARDWGWRIVNFQRYREKARKAAYDADRTASGLDAARKAVSREVPRSPDVPRAVPLSDSDSDSDSKIKNLDKAHCVRPPPRKRCPESFQVTPELRTWATENAPDVDIERETAGMRDWEFRTAKSDWPATWRSWMRKAQQNARPMEAEPVRSWEPPDDGSELEEAHA